MWLKEWKKDVKELEAKVRAIKVKLRNDWRVSYTNKDNDFPGYDQWALMVLRFKLTHLYQYRAANRGKVHTENLPKQVGYTSPIPDTSKYDKLKAQSCNTQVVQAEIHHKDSDLVSPGNVLQSLPLPKRVLAFLGLYKTSPDCK